MIPVLVVSMNSDIERREAISKKLTKFNIDYHFIDAVVGKNLSDDTLKDIDISKAQIRKQRYVSLGEIGCTLSHVKAYKYIINRSIPYCLILEDDVIFDKQFAEFVTCFNNSDLTGYGNDLVMLGGQNGIDKSRFIARGFFKKIKIGNVLFAKTIKSDKFIFRTCCYVISLDIAQRLYDLSHKEFFIADEWSYFKSLGIFNNIYIADIVDHPLDLSNSHIEHERLNSISNFIPTEDNKGLKYKLEQYRLVKFAKVVLLLKVWKNMFLSARVFVRRLNL
ncbi:glycosyltransferase family 25 protein [Pluralibacter gergoviae]|uniref:glycosyltransferase family 25 protein n=1 Tax=Pluralibacter gergoviae TaxID=61647 RepID=UPI00190D6E94|nr:glycosyltransferase family 25 protein [Pluralibacter gergoviae]EMD1656838.1 glycosyltransferase family 25 protein [Pluralibacter gergoviae]MBK4118572.1 glycosyltransferase family 25 protein [Pluralibacter gergoviae]